MSSSSLSYGDSVTIADLSGNPHPVLTRLRRHQPVAWLPALDGWLVTRRDLCIAVMGDAETFTVDDPRFSTRQVIGPSMLSLDGPEHQRHRRPFADPFRSDAVRRILSDWTHQRARDLVDRLAHRGRGDLRAELAAPLAVKVMGRVLDLGDVDVGQLLEWYQAIVASVHAVTEGGSVPETGTTAFADLHSAVSANLTTSALLGEAARSLTSDEIVSNVAVLLFGGIVTAESTTAMVIRYLLTHPAVLRRVREEQSIIAKAVEEAMRLEPTAAAVDRYATRTVDLGGAEIRSGDLVRVSLAGANRDPAVFTDPDRFDLDRDNVTGHLAFARGPHACLGVHVARLEARAAVEAVLDGLPGLRLDPSRIDQPQGLVFRAPDRVQTLWDEN